MPAATVQDKRRFQRIFYNADATLISGEASISCRVVDISLKGCLLEFAQPWLVSSGNLYTLALNLSDAVVIRMQLRFAHGAGMQAGFVCDHIDIDSMTNLRRLVELNLGDSDMLGRELAALSHL